MQDTRNSIRFTLCLMAAYAVIALGMACGSSSGGGTTGGTTGATNISVGGTGTTTGGGGTTTGSTGTASKCSNGNAYVNADANNVFTPPACQSQMYSTYGDAGFTAVNSNIIIRATDSTKNPNVADLGTSFQTEIVNASDPNRPGQFTENLAIFLVQVYGGPVRYGVTTDPNYNTNQRSMPAAHAGLNITTAQYNNFIGEVVVPALQEAGVAADDITNCFAPQVTDPNFMASIITCQ